MWIYSFFFWGYAGTQNFEWPNAQSSSKKHDLIFRRPMIMTFYPTRNNSILFTHKTVISNWIFVRWWVSSVNPNQCSNKQFGEEVGPWGGWVCKKHFTSPSLPNITKWAKSDFLYLIQKPDNIRFSIHGLILKFKRSIIVLTIEYMSQDLLMVFRIQLEIFPYISIITTNFRYCQGLNLLLVLSKPSAVKSGTSS